MKEIKEIKSLRTLSLAEVQVFSGPTNIATGGTATQSSEQHGGHPTRAIDGNTDSNWYVNGDTYTNSNWYINADTYTNSKRRE